VIRNSKVLSSIQRGAGGEMAPAVLVPEWACEVPGTNPFDKNQGKYARTDSSVTMGRGIICTLFKSTAFAVK